MNLGETLGSSSVSNEIQAMPATPNVFIEPKVEDYWPSLSLDSKACATLLSSAGMSEASISDLDIELRYSAGSSNPLKKLIWNQLIGAYYYRENRIALNIPKISLAADGQVRIPEALLQHKYNFEGMLNGVLLHELGHAGPP